MEAMINLMNDVETLKYLQQMPDEEPAKKGLTENSVKFLRKFQILKI